MARKLKEAPEQADTIEPASVGYVNTSTTQVIDETITYSRCGGALRAAREKQGLSVQEIASRLRLSAKQIEAIEADNFSVLPEPTIVRGFIRNYAKQLNIKSEPILEGYSAIVPTSTPHELIVKPSSNMTVSGYEKSKAGRYIGAALFMLLGLAAWLFYQHYIAKPSPTNPGENASENATLGANQAETAAESAATTTDLPQPALPAAERQDAMQDSAAAPVAPTTPAPSATSPVVTASASAQSTGLPATTAPTLQPSNSLGESPDTSVQLTNNGKKHIEFNATQETWINITDAKGLVVYSKVVFAGSRETLDAKPPLNITVGNAGGTVLMIDGKSTDLAPYSRANVAHIKVE